MKGSSNSQIENHWLIPSELQFPRGENGTNYTNNTHSAEF